MAEEKDYNDKEGWDREPQSAQVIPLSSEEYFEVAEIVKFTGLSRQKISELINSGKLRSEWGPGRGKGKRIVSKTALMECDETRAATKKREIPESGDDFWHAVYRQNVELQRENSELKTKMLMLEAAEKKVDELGEELKHKEAAIDMNRGTINALKEQVVVEQRLRDDLRSELNEQLSREQLERLKEQHKHELRELEYEMRMKDVVHMGWIERRRLKKEIKEKQGK